MTARIGAEFRPDEINRKVWLPLLLGLLTICLESTQTMGAAHTQVWLEELISGLGRSSASLNLAEVNHILRKSGHFVGYGTLGVLFARVWFSILRRKLPAQWTKLRIRAAGCAVFCTFLVASADELHQRYLPGRGSSFQDVLLDTAGALLLNTAFLTVLCLQRRAMVEHQQPMPAVHRLVKGQTGSWSRKLRQTALHRGRMLLRADAGEGAQANMDMLYRR